MDNSVDALLVSKQEMAQIRIALRYYGVVSAEPNAEEYIKLAQALPQKAVYLIEVEDV